MKKLMLSTLALMVTVTMSASADLSQFTAPSGFINPFNLNGDGSQGSYAGWNSAWELVDLQALTSDNTTFELLPNINTYNATDAYWSNGSGDGNKWLEATTKFEYTVGAGDTSADMSYTVDAFDLDSRYTLDAFVKVLDAVGGSYGVLADSTASITGVSAENTLNLDVSAYQGQLIQIGFVMNGINANPDTDWGSSTVTITNANVIPEPATMGLLGLFGGGIMFVRRFFA